MSDSVDIRQLLAAQLMLAEGQRDVIEALGSLREAMIVLDVKGDLRAKQAEDQRAAIDEHGRMLANIERPVVAHYDGIRLANETQAANAGKWAAILSPERIVNALKYAGPILVALGLGGGAGANFRGCGAVLTTAADAAPSGPVTVPTVGTP